MSRRKRQAEQNLVLDQRRHKPDAKLALELRGVLFWEALETLCRKAGCGFTPYAEGGVALIDAPLRTPSVSRQGIFRTAVKRTTATRDEETGTSACIVVLDIAMPLLNGLDAARQLRRELPEVKVIFLTMNEDSDVAAEAFRIGARARQRVVSTPSATVESVSSPMLAKANDAGVR